MIIDLHNHILPGVDDGAMSIEDSLEMAALAARCGIKKIVATPHYDYKTGTSLGALNDAYESLVEALEYEKINIKIEKSMEIMASNNLPQLLSEGKVWTYPNSSYFLVEFNYDEEKGYFDWLLDRCVEAGFIPVIAHPERYYAVRKHPEMAKVWMNKGFGVQINRDSLLGAFGEHAYNCSNFLLKNGWANCIASDAHSPHFRNNYWGEAFLKLPSLYGFNKLAYCLETIPEKILTNQSLI